MVNLAVIVWGPVTVYKMVIVITQMEYVKMDNVK